MTNPLDAHALLQHADGLRRLARSLVHRDEEAEDVLQDTWVAVASGAGPTRGTAPEGWLRGVVRRVAGKLARSESRRKRRETHAATRGPHGVPAADEAAERLDTRRHVLDALQRLSDPQRYALFLRYFEDLSPGAIAARQEVPVATVKSWLKRGLERLRADLDARHGGDRATWRAALLPLGAPALPGATSAPIAAATGTAAGGLVVKKVAVLVAAVVLAALAVELLVFAPRRARPAGDTAPELATARGHEDSAATLEGRGKPDRSTAKPHAGTPAERESAPGTPGGLVYVGRVVDERRRPIELANVAVHVPGHPDGEARTDANGRFRVALGAATRTATAGTLVVRTRDGRAAVRRADPDSQIVGQPTDFGTIVVGAAHDLTVRVERDARPVPGARVVVCGPQPLMRTELAEVTVDAEGRATLTGLPAGQYPVLAVAPGHGRGAALADLRTPPPGDVVLALSRERVLDVVVVEKTSRTPVAGASLTVSENLEGSGFMPYLPHHTAPPTDAAGRTRLEGLGADDPVGLLAEAPGYAGGLRDGRYAQSVPMAAAEFTVELEALRTIAWPVKTGERPVPANGTVFTLFSDDPYARASLPREARMEGGRIVGTGFSLGYFRAVARAPDGAFAPLLPGPSPLEGQETSFFAPRYVDVVVRRTDGSPATGTWVVLQGWDMSRDPEGGPVPVDEEGRARVPFTRAGEAQVFVVSEPTLRTGRPIRVVDLHQGPVRLELTLPPERPARLAVRIAGEPGLPAEYVLQTEGGSVLGIEEDPQCGWLTFALSAAPSPTRTASVRLDARGFTPVSVPLTLEAGSTRLEGSVDLQTAGVFVVRVKKPLDGTNPFTAAQAFDEVRRKWEALPPLPPPPPGEVGSLNFVETETEQLCLYSPVPAGRYRAMDQHTGEVTADVRVGPGLPPAEVVLDLSRAATVKGTVEGPPGFDLSGAQVEIEGVATEGFLLQRPGRSGIGNEGTFQLRVPGSRPVVLRAKHPFLVPDPVLGRVEVTGGRDGVRLRLVAGTRAQFRLSGVPTTRPGQAPHVPEGLKVLLFAGEPGAGEATAQPVQADEAAYWFGGYAPGTYTLWLDPGHGAPVVKRGVVFGAQETDLGELEASEGARIRVRVLVREGATPPRIAIRAVAEGKPTYERSKETQKPLLDAVLTGLGTGRFRVTAWPVGDGVRADGPRLDQTVEVNQDAEDETVLDLDLR